MSLGKIITILILFVYIQPVVAEDLLPKPPLDLKWEYKEDFIEITPPTIVEGGIVYVRSRDKTLYAISTDSGKILWKLKNVNDTYGDIIIKNNKIFTFDMEYGNCRVGRGCDSFYYLSVLDSKNGSIIKTLKLGDLRYLVEENESIFSINNKKNIVSINSNEINKEWEVDTGVYIEKMIYDNSTVYAVYTTELKDFDFNGARFSMRYGNTGIIAINSDNGTIKWNYKIGEVYSRDVDKNGQFIEISKDSPMYNVFSDSISISQGMIAVQISEIIRTKQVNMFLLFIDANTGQEIHRENDTGYIGLKITKKNRYLFKYCSITSLDSETEKETWSREWIPSNDNPNICNPPNIIASSDDFIYMVGGYNDPKFYILNTSTGETIWSYTFNAPIIGNDISRLGNIVVKDKYLFVIPTDNTLYAFGEAPPDIDSDGDGWTDKKEEEMGTNIYNKDTDGDGIPDPQDKNPLVNDADKPVTENPMNYGVIVGGALLFLIIAGVIARPYYKRAKLKREMAMTPTDWCPHCKKFTGGAKTCPHCGKETLASISYDISKKVKKK